MGAAAKVVIYGNEPFFTGYNSLQVALFDSVSGARISNAHIHLMPMMDMGSMQHGAPYENPVSEDAVNGLFPCSITFPMPSTAGNWALDVMVHNHTNNLEGDYVFSPTVTEPAHPRILSFISAADSGKYFIAYIQPQKPVVGSNNFEFAVYKNASMMSWPADSSLRFTLRPEMPTMGHGSPNNVDPVHIGNGHYQGKVNFTMTGLWWLHLDSYLGAELADSSSYFQVNF